MKLFLHFLLVLIFCYRPSQYQLQNLWIAEKVIYVIYKKIIQSDHSRRTEYTSRHYQDRLKILWLMMVKHSLWTLWYSDFRSCFCTTASIKTHIHLLAMGMKQGRLSYVLFSQTVCIMWVPWLHIHTFHLQNYLTGVVLRISERSNIFRCSLHFTILCSNFFSISPPPPPPTHTRVISSECKYN
jgi:hypothetical protein